MDLSQQTNKIVTDFTTQANSTNFGTENAGSVYNLKLALSFNIDDDTSQGTHIHTFPLDTTAEEAIVALAAKHERYSINDLRVDVQSVAPFGTSSGAVQIAYIPDPTNADFGTDLAENLAKVVRQSGSICVRPRDTKVLETKTDGTCYCKASGDPRFYSFGSIVVVIREPPAAGDYNKTTMTLTATYQFYKTTINSDTTLVKDKLAVRLTEANRGSILFALPDLFLPDDITLRCLGDFIFMLTKKVGGRITTKVYKPSFLKLKRVEATCYRLDTVLNGNFKGLLKINSPYLNVTRPCEVEYFV